MSNEPINYYERSKHIKEVIKGGSVHQPLYDEYGIKANSRCLLVGRSGSGKSSILCRILEAGFSQDCVRKMVVCNLIDDPIYSLFRKMYNKDNDENCTFYSMQELPTFAAFREEHKGERGLCLVLDDVIGADSKQTKKLIEYAIASRKLPCSTFIMSQRWFSLDPTIRTQCNYIILTGMIERATLSDICRMTIGEENLPLFMAMYRYSCARQFDFLKIDLGKMQEPNRMFSRGLTQFFHIHNGTDFVEVGELALY